MTYYRSITYIAI